MDQSKIASSPSPEEAQLLASAFDFDENTLATNRKGRITEVQRRRFINFSNRNFWVIALWAFFLCTILYLLTLPAPPQVYPRDRNRSAEILFLIMLALFLLAREVNTSIKHRKDLATIRVYKIEGIIELEIVDRTGRRGIKYYYLKIQNEKFKLTPQQFSALKDHEPCVIYHFLNSHWILSVERLSDQNLIPEV
ncbi:MAG TPA: hypothetical protein VHL11_14515 [Phototrophicaceae bacterium]|jgi:hypothetical protein|nr:hypothetical protein [Phototrophicaceae bacterium]